MRNPDKCNEVVRRQVQKQARRDIRGRPDTFAEYRNASDRLINSQRDNWMTAREEQAVYGDAYYED